MGLFREQRVLLIVLEWCAVIYHAPPDPAPSGGRRRSAAYRFYCLRVAVVLVGLPTLTYFRMCAIMQYVNIQSVSYVMWLLAMLVETFVIVVVVLANLFNRSHYGALIDHLDRLEHAIERAANGTTGGHGYPPYGLIIGAITLLCGAFHAIIFVRGYTLAMPFILQLRLEVVVIDLLSIQVVFLLLAVGRCARQLRRMLQDAIADSRLADVCGVLRLRDDLVHTVSLINRCYGAFFFGCGASWAVGIICILYFDFVLAGVFKLDTAILCMHTMMLVWKCSVTGGLLMVAGLATERVKEVTLLTDRVGWHPLNSRPLMKIIDKALLKCQFQDIRFTVFGLFTIDNSLTYMVICSIVTYLVILIQFRQMEERHETTNRW